MILLCSDVGFVRSFTTFCWRVCVLVILTYQEGISLTTCQKGISFITCQKGISLSVKVNLNTSWFSAKFGLSCPETTLSTGKRKNTHKKSHDISLHFLYYHTFEKNGLLFDYNTWLSINFKWGKLYRNSQLHHRVRIVWLVV